MPGRSALRILAAALVAAALAAGVWRLAGTPVGAPAGVEPDSGSRALPERAVETPATLQAPPRPSAPEPAISAGIEAPTVGRAPREAAAPGGPAEPEPVVTERRWPPPVAGDVRGRLLSERGAWREEDLPGRDELVLDLVSLAEPRIERRARIESERDEEGAIALSFVFEDVPEGNYELTLSALDNFRWHPVSTVVAPPAESVEFLRYDLDRALPLVFRVTDAATGEPIERYEARHLKQTESPEGMFLHAGPLDPGAFPVQGSFAWSLWADGYAPAFGDETSFFEAELDGERARVAELRLERGWAARVLALAREPVMRPVAGVEIALDGESAGATGADGALRVRRAERPERIEARGGWRVTNDPFADRAGASVEVRGHVLPLLLERAE